MSLPENPTTAEPPHHPSLLQAPATRREMFLFGLLLLSIIWAFALSGPRTIVVVPDTHVKVGVIT